MAIAYRLPPSERIEICQYIYPPNWNGHRRRCWLYAGYRIGETIYLCGHHVPGVIRGTIKTLPETAGKEGQE